MHHWGSHLKQQSDAYFAPPSHLKQQSDAHYAPPSHLKQQSDAHYAPPSRFPETPISHMSCTSESVTWTATSCKVMHQWVKQQSVAKSCTSELATWNSNQSHTKFVPLTGNSNQSHAMHHCATIISINMYTSVTWIINYQPFLQTTMSATKNLNHSPVTSTHPTATKNFNQIPWTKHLNQIIYTYMYI